MAKKRGPPKGEGGRPPKCTQKFLEELEAFLRGGAEPKTACLALGISRDSRNRWLERGQPDGHGNYPPTPFGKFCAIMDKAPAIARMSVDLALHKVARMGDTGAAKLYYQRVRAENFEPHNLNPAALPPLGGNDDDENLYAALATRLAGLARTGGAEAAPR